VTIPDDPILRRREQIAQWSALAKRTGYLAMLIAMIVFVIGFATNFSTAVVGIIIGAIAVSGLLLIPALIFGYGVKAAEQEDRGEPFRY
jgi:uncharacterized membrane protein